MHGQQNAKLNFMKIRPVAAELFHMDADRQKWRS